MSKVYIEYEGGVFFINFILQEGYAVVEFSEDELFAYKRAIKDYYWWQEVLRNKVIEQQLGSGGWMRKKVYGDD